MEDALVQLTIMQYIIRFIAVLILVLMEDALVLKFTVIRWLTRYSLNPCFNGRCTSTNYFSFM